ncbi:hypothetical protein [Malonomonas rubra]|uniref:hypothetical protein n=1 Tax=Malonomonas rubra TaxID=57040 RepID=UPI0026EB6C67|nr:hypothetical protein [Malonomonas rubra]
MKKFFVLMLMVTLMLPVGAMAMSHEEHGSHDKMMDMDHDSMEKMEHGKAMDMDHDSMEKMEHGSGMDMGGKMIMLQDEEVDGVMGAAHLLDVKEKMAAHGMSQTHHLMIGFMNNEGDALGDGTVAVKVEAPDGNVSEPIMMMGMKDAFGADITLDQKGTYHFAIGTKLADGKKRTFHMHYDNK